jgi:hypothetical protein
MILMRLSRQNPRSEMLFRFGSPQIPAQLGEDDQAVSTPMLGGRREGEAKYGPGKQGTKPGTMLRQEIPIRGGS